MEYFGSGKPYFAHRIKVPVDLPTGAFEWCQEYPDEDQPFRRFHCEWDHYGHNGYVIIQFEWEEAAFMYKLRWGA